MIQGPHRDKPLSVYRTFVVQLHGATGGGQFSGRVEHVASGTTYEFTSAESLLEFLADNISGDSWAPSASVR